MSSPNKISHTITECVDFIDNTQDKGIDDLIILEN